MSNSTHGAIILGASSGVGRAVASQLAKEGFSLILTARDERDLEALASHLRICYGSICFVVQLNLEDPLFDTRSYYENCQSLLPTIDTVLICAGMIHPKDDGIGSSSSLISQLVHVNFLNIIKIISRFIEDFQKRNQGTLVVFSSVAAAAPRKRNVVYAASKVALESYCRGLQHALAATEVRIQIYALGYVDTAMSYGQKLLFPIVSPDAVAEYVIKNLDSGIRFQYFPRFWSLIAFALKRLPWFLFKRLSF